jgi:prepilin-type N-terminal cleavage/methylation domain-containing protein
VVRNRLRRVLVRSARDDDGVTLIEIMVAITILAVLTASVGLALLSIQSSAFKSKERAAAANLATREMELVRNLFHSADTAPAALMTTGDVTNADPLPGQSGPAVVDGVSYTVKREVAWLVTGNGASACDGGSIVSYPSVSVHVVVTWPNMGDVKPVTTDSLLTPPKSVLNASTSYYAIKVLDRDGLPSEGRTVQVTGPSGTFTDTTGPDGCATFLLATAGTYTATMTEGSSGYVSYTGVSTATATLTAGSLTVRSFSYDQGESFTATLVPPAGFALPTAKPALVFANSGIQPAGTATYASNSTGTTTVSNLWPFATGYSIWAGSCAGSDPALLGGRPAPVTPARGSTTAVNVPLQGVAITTTNQGLPANVPVTATYNGTGTCPAGDGTIALGTSSNGVLNVALPYGTWTISATISGQNLSDNTVVLTPAAGDTALLNAS